MCPNNQSEIVDLISKDVSSPNKNGIKEKTSDKFSSAAEYLWSHCAENPGHTHFIPIKKFSLSDLPIMYRKKYFLDHIKRLSNVTVRIIVKKNPGRPGDTGYKHGRLVDAGTGTVTEILPECQSVRCDCQYCLQNNDHQRVPTNMESIRILTAYHVVPGCLEAQNSTVDFFYDDATDKGNMITLKGVRMCENNVKEDWSVFECVTSDRNLVDKLQSNLDEIDHWSMHTAYEGGLAVVVSHPHGMPKHISIGRWMVDEAALLAEKRFIEEFAHLRGINLDNEYLLHILQDIARRIMRSTRRAIVNEDKSEILGIECDVKFPNEEKLQCQIFLLDKPVKDTKKSLLSQGNLSGLEDELYLEMELPDDQTQIMDDEKDIDYYLDDLTRAYCIRVKRYLVS